MEIWQEEVEAEGSSAEEEALEWMRQQAEEEAGLATAHPIVCRFTIPLLQLARMAMST